METEYKTVEEAKEAVLRNFPLPTPRPAQVEALNKAVEAIMAGKKFIIIDGPVGSGKSAINYALLATFGGGAYITPFKQLQDQVISEGWEGVRNIKGRGTYTCNYAAAEHSRGDIACDYKGYDIMMCRNDENIPSLRGTTFDEAVMITAVEKAIAYKGFNPTELEKVTGFDERIIKEYGGSIEAVMQSIFRFLNSEESNDQQVSSVIGCPYNRTIECPVESHRILGRMAKVKVMNPEIMFLLGAFYPELRFHKVLVYDEAHKIPDVTHRLFTINIPHQLLADKAGITIDNNLIDNMPRIKALYKIMNSVKGAPILPLYINSELDPSKYLVKEVMSKMRNNFDGIHEILRDYFRNANPYKLTDLYTYLDQFFTNEDDFQMLQRAMDDFEFIQKEDFQVVLDILTKLVECVGQYRKSEKPFILTKCEKDWYELHWDFQHLPGKRGTMYKCTEIKPFDIAGLMINSFYNNSELVILSSGTWIGWESTLREIGVYQGNDKSNIAIIKIPSTFDKSKRPIYMAADGVDMSFKEDNGKYWYEQNPQAFADITWRNIQRLRDNGNIILHCNSFKIAKILAEHLPEYDAKNFIVHFNGKETIINKATMKVVKTYTKEELLSIAMRKGTKGMIYISPSLVEGVDFKHDRARAQIIVKSPIPYMGDAYVKEFLKVSPEYIDRRIWMDLTQMYGRVMRADDDFGITLIQDFALKKTFAKVLKNPEKISKMNIGYATEAIQARLDSRGNLQYL